VKVCVPETMESAHVVYWSAPERFRVQRFFKSASRSSNRLLDQ